MAELRLGVISYCYHRESVTEVLGRVAALGLGHVELWYGHPDGRVHYGQAGESAARQVRNEARALGLDIPTFCIGGWDRVDLERFRRAIAFAQALGAETISGCATPEVAEAAAPLFAAAGLRLGIENHKGNVFEKPADLLPVLARTDPAIGCNVDSGHFLASGVDVLDAVRQLAGRIYHVHLKDVRGQAAAPVGAGDLPLAALLGQLRATGFGGLLSIEHEIPGDPTDELRLSVANVRAALAG